MVCKYCLQIKVLNKEDEHNFKVGNRRRYRDKEGHLVFYKRVKATEYDKFIEEMNSKGKVKIS